MRRTMGWKMISPQALDDIFGTPGCIHARNGREMSLGVCELVFGAATDEGETGLLGPSSAPLNDQTLTVTVAGTVTSSTAATLSCEAIGNSGLTYSETASMTATQVGRLNP